MDGGKEMIRTKETVDYYEIAGKSQGAVWKLQNSNKKRKDRSWSGRGGYGFQVDGIPWTLGFISKRESGLWIFR